EVELAVGLLVHGRLVNRVATPARVPVRRIRIGAPAAVHLDHARIGERIGTVGGHAARIVRGTGDRPGVVGTGEELAEHLFRTTFGLGAADVGRGEPALVVPVDLDVVGFRLDLGAAVLQVEDGQAVLVRAAGDQAVLDGNVGHGEQAVPGVARHHEHRLRHVVEVGVDLQRVDFDVQLLDRL